MIDYKNWQSVEKEKIQQIDEFICKIEGGSKINLWELVPELELKNANKAWGMLDPQTLREGQLISRPQVFLIPINPPQYPGFTFQKEYGKSPSWLAQLIKAHPDEIKPVITAQPIDYEGCPEYEIIFEASRQTYSGNLPPCAQWRVESLISKYRMTIDSDFKEYYSNEYYKLAKDYWASQVMKTFGFSRATQPKSVEGLQLRHFLAKSYSLASFGLSEIVEHVINASSKMPRASPTVKMNAAWRILDPYIDYLVKPLRSDLSGLSLKTASKTESSKKLQLLLPLIVDKSAFSRTFLKKILKSTESSKFFEFVKTLEKMIPMEIILRLNSASATYLTLPGLSEIEKPQVKHAILEDEEYSRNLYHVWKDLYEKGVVEKKLLERLFELSSQYTKNVQEIADKKLGKKIKIQKAKIAAGTFGSGLFTFYGLSSLAIPSINPTQSMEAILWASETSISFIETIRKIQELLNLEQVAKDQTSERLRKSIMKGNIVDFEMINTLEFSKPIV
jgi:hypothetical protein